MLWSTLLYLANITQLDIKLKNCDNMWDMNILYEDYLNIGMPLVQAKKLGRIDDNNDRLNGELIYGTFGF